MSEERMVMCRKLGKLLPGLKRPPYKNELGKKLYEEVSREAWDQWLQFSVRLINTRGVDLASEAGQKFMMEQTSIYFGYSDGEIATTAWTPPKEHE